MVFAALPGAADTIPPGSRYIAWRIPEAPRLNLVTVTDQPRRGRLRIVVAPPYTPTEFPEERSSQACSGSGHHRTSNTLLYVSDIGRDCTYMYGSGLDQRRKSASCWGFG